jgi:hypothetical protein
VLTKLKSRWAKGRARRRQKAIERGLHQMGLRRGGGGLPSQSIERGAADHHGGSGDLGGLGGD